MRGRNSGGEAGRDGDTETHSGALLDCVQRMAQRRLHEARRSTCHDVVEERLLLRLGFGDSGGHGAEKGEEKTRVEEVRTKRTRTRAKSQRETTRGGAGGLVG